MGVGGGEGGAIGCTHWDLYMRVMNRDDRGGGRGGGAEREREFTIQLNWQQFHENWHSSIQWQNCKFTRLISLALSSSIIYYWKNPKYWQNISCPCNITYNTIYNMPQALTNSSLNPFPVHSESEIVLDRHHNSYICTCLFLLCV